MSKIETKVIRQNVVLFAALLILTLIVFVLNISIGNVNTSINEAEENRKQALKIVDELRQSSDDLTRMARMYAVTGDSSYINYFNEIIKIRDGEVSRPMDYHEIYWDLVMANRVAPRPRAEKTPLVDLLKTYVSSSEAVDYFKRAKKGSDDLILIEVEAFNAMKGVYKDSLGDYSITAPPNKQLAIDLLHGKAYLKAKANIMKSIQDFYRSINRIINESVSESLDDLRQLRWMMILMIGTSTIALILVVIANVRFLLRSKRNMGLEDYSGKFTLIKFFREAENSWVVVLVSFIFSALVIIFLFYANSIIKKNIEQSVSQALLTVNQTTNKNIQDWLSDLENNAAIIVQDELLRQDLISLLEGKIETDQNNLDKHISSNVLQSSYIGYLIVNQDQVVMQTSSPNNRRRRLNDLETADALMRIQNNKSLIFSFPSKGGVSEFFNNAIKVYSPILDGDKIKGTLILLFNPKERFTEVLHQGRLGNSGESYAFNNKGMMISESRFNDQLVEMGFIERDQTSELNIELKDPTVPGSQYTQMANDALKGYAGINVLGYNDYRGIKVVGTWNWFENFGFGMATEIDYDEAFKTYLLVNKIGVYTGVLFILLIITLTILFIFSRLKLSELNLEMTRQKSLLENTIESLPHPFYVINTRDYSLMLANKAAKDMSSSGIITTCHALTNKRDTPCDSKNDPCPLKIVRETKKPVVVEHTHFDKNGDKIIAEVHGYPIFNENGEVHQMIEYSLDITERKFAEQVLSDERQRFKQLLESTPDAILIINDNGRIQIVNQQMLNLFGYTYDEIIDKPLEILIPTDIEKTHISHRKNFFKEPSNRQMGDRRDLFAVRKDKSQFPVEISLNPIKTKDGVLVAAAIRDISERKKAEEKIKVSERKFRSIAATASDAIISANSKGRIESWNNAAETIFGYTKKEAIGEKIEMIIPNEHHKGHQSGMKRVLSGGKKHAIGKTIELEGRTKVGNIIPVELSLSNWKSEEGMQFSAIIRDITDRKKIEQALKKANKRMSSELNVAKEIQMSMLPLIFPAFPKRNEIDIYANLIPAREVGGDFYDFHFLDDNHIYFVVGDVSGKGVPAALMMAVTKTLLKSTAGNDRSTASILTHVNNEIAKDNDAYMFITIFIAILNITTGEMVYSNAGHNPSFIIKSKREIIKLGDLHGPVVGAMEDMTYSETKVNIDKSDIIFAYTDGITEAQNLKEELYSDLRLINLLKEGVYNNPKTLINLVEDSVFKFQGKAEQFDDITALSLQYLGDKKYVMKNSFSITIKNQLNQMPQVIESFEAFGEKNKLSFGVIQKFNIAIDELLSNIISYGFQDDLKHEILVEVELRNERLIITLTDDGVPFNPFQNNPPDTKLSIAERNIGGLGIHIVKNLVDEYDYKRQADKNIITLVKYNINK